MIKFERIDFDDDNGWHVIRLMLCVISFIVGAATVIFSFIDFEFTWQALRIIISALGVFTASFYKITKK